MAMRETCGFEEKSNKMANYSDVSASNSKHVSLYIREPGDALVTTIYQINPVIARAFFLLKYSVSSKCQFMKPDAVQRTEIPIIRRAKSSSSIFITTRNIIHKRMKLKVI